VSPRRGPRVTRRGFLIGTAVVGAGAWVGWRFGVPAARLGIARALDGAAPPGGIEAPPDAWIEVTAAGVTLYLAKVEMGQGIHTALAQIAAEELELPLDRLAVRSAPTDRGLDDRNGTGASASVSGSWAPLREAAALTRAMLRAAAADAWGVDATGVVADQGRLVHRDRPGETLAYEDVADRLDPEAAPDDVPPFKAKGAYREIGRARPRVDLAEKLAGTGGYGLDVRMEGMRYGAVARPPRLGARLAAAAPGGAMEVPGVTDVVIEDGFAGVVATRRSAAAKGVAALDLTWEGPETPVTQAAVDAACTVRGDADPGAGVVVQRDGDPTRALRGRTDVRASFRTAMAAHAHLEPQAALVHVAEDRVEAYVATQSPTLVRDLLADATDRPKEAVSVTATWLGGGFGRRLNVEVATDAARLSRASGVPVHVAWTREEEFRHGYLRPPVHNVLEARLEDGRIAAWRHRQASGDVAFPFLPAVAQPLLGADFGAWRGATSPYGGMARRATVAERVELPVPTGWWRGLGLLPNVFATESFLDELAAAAGADSLAFRLAHLNEDEDDVQRRLAGVLRAAAEAADWGGPLPAGRGRGIATSVDVGTCVAQVTEASFEEGAPTLHRVVVAVDPGVVVNQDGVRAQVEGSVAWGVSSLLHEAVTLEDGRVAPGNFDTYAIARASDVPDVEVVILEGDDVPHGMGEPPLGPVAASIANAVVAAGGPRARSLPARWA
jgi:isoquinoline 1-oxidoreductase beta subunit